MPTHTHTQPIYQYPLILTAAHVEPPALIDYLMVRGLQMQPLRYRAASSPSLHADGEMAGGNKRL